MKKASKSKSELRYRVKEKRMNRSLLSIGGAISALLYPGAFAEEESIMTSATFISTEYSTGTSPTPTTMLLGESFKSSVYVDNNSLIESMIDLGSS